MKNALTVIGVGIVLATGYFAGMCTKCMVNAATSREYRHAMVKVFDQLEDEREQKYKAN